MTHVYLCDDSSAILSTMEEQLREIAERHFLAIQISAYESGEQLLFHWEEGSSDPDVIFLDIMMPGVNGLETAKKLRSGGCRAELVFLTANPEYVFESFDVSPANYIIKNQMSKKRLEEIFLKSVEVAGKKKKTVFSCENGSVRKNISVADISYFEVQNRRVTVHFGESSFEFYSSLEDVEQKLASPVFIRIHRSYLVNLSWVEEIERNCITLIGDCHLPLGITYAKKVKESMNRYFSHQHD